MTGAFRDGRRLGSAHNREKPEKNTVLPLAKTFLATSVLFTWTFPICRRFADRRLPPTPATLKCPEIGTQKY